MVLGNLASGAKRISTRSKMTKNRWSIVNPDPTLRQNLMIFGFECGKGWWPLICETLDRVQAIVDRDGLDDISITQVKEKFGELRIYTSSFTEEIDDIIQAATDRSLTICEQCGKPGSLRNNHGWLITLCDECQKKMS